MAPTCINFGTRYWRRFSSHSGSILLFTGYETIPLVRLETSGGVLSTVDMMLQRRDGPRWLREPDDDDDDNDSQAPFNEFNEFKKSLYCSLVCPNTHRHRDTQTTKRAKFSNVRIYVIYAIV